MLLEYVMYTGLRPLQACSLLENGQLVKRLISAIEQKIQHMRCSLGVVSQSVDT